MKPFTKLTVVILVIFGFVHILRLITGWPVTVNGAVMPMWVSGIALVVAWGLAALVWREHSPH